jgi:hypothetical protein
VEEVIESLGLEVGQIGLPVLGTKSPMLLDVSFAKMKCEHPRCNNKHNFISCSCFAMTGTNHGERWPYLRCCSYLFSFAGTGGPCSAFTACLEPVGSGIFDGVAVAVEATPPDLACIA